MREFPSIQSLRSFNESCYTPKLNDLVFVTYHSNPGDCGNGLFILKIIKNELINGINLSNLFNDNDGTIIKPLKQPNNLSQNETAYWVRLIDGDINIRYFGSIGQMQNDDGERIQKAINFASNIVEFYQFASFFNCGSNIYIPKGNSQLYSKMVFL